MKFGLKKGKITIALLFSVLFIFMTAGFVSAVTIDANNYAAAGGNHYNSIRGNAQGNSALHLSTNSAVNYNINLQANRLYTIIVSYSNDGGSDVIGLALNNVVDIGKFRTVSTGSGGYGWNTFTNSQVMYFKTKNAGQYTLTIWVPSADSYGVELNTITIN